MTRGSENVSQEPLTPTPEKRSESAAATVLRHLWDGPASATELLRRINRDNTLPRIGEPGWRAVTTHTVADILDAVDAIGEMMGYQFLVRDDKNRITLAFPAFVPVVARDDAAELRAALEAVYRWLRSEFAEPDPTTGEAVEAAAREIWETVCAALAATEGSTESVVARDDAAELRAALEMLLNASHRGGYDSGLTIEAVERAEALIAPGLTQERRIELAHAAWLDGLKRRLTTFEESRLAASEGQP